MKTKKNYRENDIIAAVAAVKNGESFRTASAKYNVPTSTVRDRFHGKYQEGKNLPGPNSVLSTDQENSLRDYLLHMAKIGYGVCKKNIPNLIKEILDSAQKDSPESYQNVTASFKNNMPSKTWVYKYLARNPTLSLRTPENLGHQRAYVTENGIRSWFANLTKFLKDEHNIDAESFLAPENSSRIFNLDESGFPLAGTNGKLKIITAKGAKNVYRLAPDTKEQVTVLGCVSAAGNFCNPFVIFPGMRPKYNLQDVNPGDYDLGHSHNGWMTSDLFFEWLANIFYPSIEKSVTFPIIIFLDGHVSHLNLAVSSFCRENGIIMYCFPPHASHIIQPLDVAVYGPLKKEWNNSLDSFAREFKGLAMSKTHFFKVFDKAWKICSQKKQMAVSGFRKCGLVPFNPNAVAYDRLLLPSAPLQKTSRELTSPAEKIGMERIFQVFEDCISDDWKKIFSRRYENAYDVVENSDLGRMYNFYKRSRDMIGGVRTAAADIIEEESVACDTAPLPSSSQAPPRSSPLCNVVPSALSLRASSPQAHPRSSSPRNAVSSPSANDMLSSQNVILNLPESSIVMATEVEVPDQRQRPLMDSSVEIDPTSYSERTPSSPVPSTSKGTPFMTDKYDISPFKSHLKISDKLIITRKFTKKSTKKPDAISGKVYFTLEAKKQEEKAEKLRQQEEKRRQRQEKQSIALTKKNEKKRVRRESSSESEDQNILMDDSEDDLNLEEDNCCAACLGCEEWNTDNAWLGCSNEKCNKWFHKSCLSQNVVDMSPSEIKAFDFYCKLCQKNKNKDQRNE